MNIIGDNLQSQRYGDIYTVQPAVNGFLSIESFSNTSDKLNLTAHSTIHSMSDLVISSGSVIITFPTTGQKIRIVNLTPADISEINFMFCKSESVLTQVSQVRSIVITVVSAIVGMSLVLFVLIMVYQQHQAANRELKEMKYWNQIAIDNPTKLSVTDLINTSNTKLLSRLTHRINAALQLHRVDGQEMREFSIDSIFMRDNSSSVGRGSSVGRYNSSSIAEDESSIDISSEYNSQQSSQQSNQSYWDVDENNDEKESDPTDGYSENGEATPQQLNSSNNNTSNNATTEMSEPNQLLQLHGSMDIEESNQSLLQTDLWDHYYSPPSLSHYHHQFSGDSSHHVQQHYDTEEEEDDISMESDLMSQA